ncbi:hypothetical protein BC936DRAFT_144331 [Jimgerdemannia flammicorona]|uniref:Uncharacterized protein n=1 Tax=Jimgerdemannia flammicorona TaxID=994334 RepID=A0A433DCP0_9FUNG|nr:hypothetical protein BC936DRAFT_144331 [Jimgerdemannia flammicorona]
MGGASVSITSHDFHFSIDVTNAPIHPKDASWYLHRFPPLWLRQVYLSQWYAVAPFLFLNHHPGPMFATDCGGGDVLMVDGWVEADGWARGFSGTNSAVNQEHPIHQHITIAFVCRSRIG